MSSHVSAARPKVGHKAARKAPQVTRLPSPAEAKAAFGRAADDLGPVVTAVMLAIPVVAAALFYVWTHVSTVRLGYEMSEAAKQHRALLEVNRGLRIEVAALKSPERLEKLGRTKYELAPPTAKQIIRVKSR